MCGGDAAFCQITLTQGRNHWGSEGSAAPKIWTDHPNFFGEERDYRYVTDYSARNWVYHPYFVFYNNLDQEIRPPNFENVIAPLPLPDCIVHNALVQFIILP